MQHVNVRSRFVLILITTLVAVWLYQRQGLKLAQDLRGGTSIRFSIDVTKAKAEGRVEASMSDSDVMKHTIDVIRDRVNRSGLQEIEILDLGENKFEINMPASSEGDTEGIVKLVTALGDLQFRIEVLPEADYPGPEATTKEGLKRTRVNVWPDSQEAFHAFKAQEVQRWKDAEAQGAAYVPSRPPFRLVPVTAAERGRRHPDGFALVEDPADPKERFDGGILSNVSIGRGERNEPVTHFDVKLEYQGVFETWTGRNLLLPMAIVLNGTYMTGPTIQAPLGGNGVQVTLGESDYETARRKAEELMTTLQTGSLKVNPVQEAKTKLGARLAGEARDRGVWATVAALLLVVLFMLVYYRWMGLVANVALVLNLVLLLGALAAFQSALSLPGIAGIVLTLAAAVDANILINERIREERLAGRSVHRSIAEGYSRALTTIVDANMTTVITAVFLFIYGSGSIRGFAVSLILGLLISMFTAIYVTRAIFEWQLARGGLKEISALRRGGLPTVRWMGLRRILVPISVAGVVLGLIAFASVDRYTLYDIDFTGGQKVQMGFSAETTVDQVKARLGGEPVPVEVSTLVRDEQGQNVTRRRVVQAGPYDGAEVYAVRSAANMVELKVQRSVHAADLSPQEQAQALEGFLRARFRDRLLPEWTSGNPQPFGSAEASPEAPPAQPSGPAPLIPTGPAPLPGAAAGGDEELRPVQGGLTFDLSFVDPTQALTPEILDRILTEDLPHLRPDSSERRTLPASQVARQVVVRAAPQQQPGVRTFQVWLKTTAKVEAATDASGTSSAASTRSIDAAPEAFRLFLGEWLGSPAFKGAVVKALGSAAAAEDISRSAAFPSQDQISASVAERLKNDALIALVLSLIGIIIYVAIRFQSKSMGIASVLCLFHDVAISLGLVAAVNAFGLVDAKINLTMVAAVLTLVGFSINDTVVVYDRIRENRGKRPDVTARIIDASINQTLSRTLRTTATILLVCGVLFAFNVGQRNVLEGFAFTLIVGLIVGTYSSVAIASPLLLYLPWVWAKLRHLAPSSAPIALCARHVLLGLLLPFALALWALWGLAFCLYAFVVGLALFTPWALSDHGGEPEAA